MKTPQKEVNDTFQHKFRTRPRKKLNIGDQEKKRTILLKKSHQVNCNLNRCK